MTNSKRWFIRIAFVTKALKVSGFVEHLMEIIPLLFFNHPMNVNIVLTKPALQSSLFINIIGNEIESFKFFKAMTKLQKLFLMKKNLFLSKFDIENGAKNTCSFFEELGNKDQYASSRISTVFRELTDLKELNLDTFKYLLMSKENSPKSQVILLGLFDDHQTLTEEYFKDLLTVVYQDEPLRAAIQKHDLKEIEKTTPTMADLLSVSDLIMKLSAKNLHSILSELTTKPLKNILPYFIEIFWFRFLHDPIKTFSFFQNDQLFDALVLLKILQSMTTTYQETSDIVNIVHVYLDYKKDDLKKSFQILVSEFKGKFSKFDFKPNPKFKKILATRASFICESFKSASKHINKARIEFIQNALTLIKSFCGFSCAFATEVLKPEETKIRVKLIENHLALFKEIENALFNSDLSYLNLTLLTKFENHFQSLDFGFLNFPSIQKDLLTTVICPIYVTLKLVKEKVIKMYLINKLKNRSLIRAFL